MSRAVAPVQVNSIRAITVVMSAMHRSSPARGASPLVVLAAVASLGGIAVADTFGGFSGVDRAYQVNQDRICTPLMVAQGAAAGPPVCQKVGADVVAKLSIKPPAVQRGAKAAFSATAAGKTLTSWWKLSGPVLCPLERVQGRTRVHLLVFAKDVATRAALLAPLRQDPAFLRAASRARARVIVDVDPMQML